ncbi:MAG: enoyl-CoA hydratase/isomerase family protein [Oscillospiraceae bacterium]|jgi:3-hydroxyacyl-CoA dehydrogenase|nr:enoyl-CoA hydratase/isomerase family protein [Oscillospiraceae bacterium]
MKKPIVLSDRKVVCSNAEAALLELGDGIACVQFLSKGNSITPSVREFLLELVSDDLKGFDGLVIGTQGKNFSVGANLTTMKEGIDNKDFAAFEKRVRAFQQMTMAIKYSKKPIVAAPYGMTLGGGLEVVLHTSARAALNKSFMGLVEVGVGLIPGGGGTKESALLVGNAAPDKREEIMKAVFRKLLTRTVTKSAEDALEKRYLEPGDLIVTAREPLIAWAKTLCLELLEAGYVPGEAASVTLPGKTGYDTLCAYAGELLEAGEITPYDVEIGRKLARVLTGGETADEAACTERQLLDLECLGFLELVQTPGTYERISHFLQTNTLLRK